MLKMMFQWIRNKLTKEDGMETVQVILITAIALVLTIVIFFPWIEDLFSAMLEMITKWFETNGENIFK